MIAMLRRRLMSNMAKAKNIAVGTVTATIENTGAGGLFKHSSLTVSDLDFMPTNVVVVREGTGSRGTVYVWDSTGYYIGSNGIDVTTITRLFNSNGFVMEKQGNTGSSDLFAGTYNYVAWQE